MRSPTLLRRWPAWVPHAARWWAWGYGALAIFWAAGGVAGFPLADVDGRPFGGRPVATAVATVLLGGCLLVLLSATRASRAAVLGLRLAAGTALLGTFGLALSGVGAVATGRLANPGTLAAQLLALVGALLVFATAQVQARRCTARCVRCGVAHGEGADPGAPLLRPPPTAASSRAQRAAYLSLLGILPWAGLKVHWAAGGSALGMTSAEWRASIAGAELSTLSRLLDHLGIDITVAAALVGGLLVAALLQRWGLRAPRWTLLAPAWIGASSLVLYGTLLIVYGALAVAGVVPPGDGDPAPYTSQGLAWMILLGGTSFGGLGAALTIGAVSYQQRSQPTCRPRLGRAQTASAR